MTDTSQIDHRTDEAKRLDAQRGFTNTDTPTKLADKSAKPVPDEPKTANEVLARVDERHYVKVAPVDMNTTPGIKEQVERNTKAIAALANFIDGGPARAV